MRALLAAVVIAVAAACSNAPVLPSSPIPPTPDAPAGWVSLGALAGSGAVGRNSLQMTPVGGKVAVHASCLGTGTLFVVVSASWPGSGEAASAPVGIFNCDSEPGSPNRLEFTVPSTGDVTATGWLEEGNGALARSSYVFSVEVPAN